MVINFSCENRDKYVTGILKYTETSHYLIFITLQLYGYPNFPKNLLQIIKTFSWYSIFCSSFLLLIQ